LRFGGGRTAGLPSRCSGMERDKNRKTANEPIDGTDPGGTRPRPAPPGGRVPTPGTATPDKHVRSGDENDPPRRPSADG
jgi:hypothetical protein